MKIYDAQEVPAAKRLKNLTIKDIVKTKKAPDLDKKAAETRYFCPHLVTLTTEKSLHEGSLHDRAVHNVAKYCSRMYQNMENFNSKELVKAGRKLISQYMALEEEVMESNPSDTRAWRAKPKFHYLSHILDQVELATIPETLGIIGMRLLLPQCNAFTTEEVAQHSLGRLQKKFCSSG